MIVCFGLLVTFFPLGVGGVTDIETTELAAPLLKFVTTVSVCACGLFREDPADNSLAGDAAQETESMGRIPDFEMADEAFEDIAETSVCESPPGSTRCLHDETSPTALSRRTPV